MIVIAVEEWEGQRSQSTRDGITIIFLLCSRSSPCFLLLKIKRLMQQFYQNKKLTQQLDAQKNEIHVLEVKFNLLRGKQKAIICMQIANHSLSQKQIQHRNIVSTTKPTSFFICSVQAKTTYFFFIFSVHGRSESSPWNK